MEKCENFKDKSLIVELLCKIGDTVYILNHVFCACVTPEVDYYEVLEEKIETISIGGSEITMESEQSEWYMSDLGKTIFISREDAEKGLKND